MAGAVVDEPGLRVVLAACVAIALLDGVDRLGLIAEGVVFVIGCDSAGGDRDRAQDRSEAVGRFPQWPSGKLLAGGAPRGMT
ncbi:MAG: hypothetical protein AAF496_10090 [Pseudomonadota bacterium]